MNLFLDIETRSCCDLRKAGQYAYAEHPTTEILCVAWALDNDPVAVWYPRTELPPDLLAVALADPAVSLVAHNASFERVLLTGAPGQRIGMPAAIEPLGRWVCTAARAACMGLPRTLEGAGGALGLACQKDKDGYRLMLRMCKPKPKSSPPQWVDDNDSLRRLGAYCARDVEVERLIYRKLPPLLPAERAAWETTEEMNDRGVRVDTDLLLRLAFLIDDAERDLNSRISAATAGAVPRVTNHGSLTRWLATRGIDDAAETGIGKAALAALLERDDIDSLVRGVLLMRREGGKSSAAKYRAILERLSRDGRLRGALVYCGAASTGRWSSRGAQLQNLPRGGSVKNVNGAIRDLLAGATLGEVEDLHGPPMVVASELLRPVFVAAPTTWLARGDYSQIEARVLPWLAGAEWKLDAFRRYDARIGPDLYRVGASGIYGKAPEEIDSTERQVGKVSELALGFQGGPGALQAMARGYGVKIPKFSGEDRRAASVGTDQWIVNKWRTANPEISATGYDGAPGFWKQLERAAIECMESAPGVVVRVGGNGRPVLEFRRNREAMALRLPSGRSLIYWTPRLRNVETPWGPRLSVVYRSEDAQTKQWAEFAAYGGLWTENVVQATARDLMADALVRGRARGFAGVLTVHDEGIFELPRSEYQTAADAATAVESLMRETPAWAAGLPVAADASADQRYVKA